MFIHSYKSLSREPYCQDGWNIAAFPTPNYNDMFSIRDWCYQAFGEAGIDNRWFDNIGYGEVLFSRESDLALFILKWS